MCARLPECSWSPLSTGSSGAFAYRFKGKTPALSDKERAFFLPIQSVTRCAANIVRLQKMTDIHS